jgi:3'-phosphoadenosine 5'-phosphosulfate sulfotransferase (PAPS reductase)/FAD synthetase
MIKCVVPVSGGKDSQSCLKLATKYFNSDEILGVFCDTQFEHPLTYQHIEKLKEIYNIQIVKLNDGNVYDKILRYGRFPSDVARFCTDELKIRIGKQFYSMLARLQGEGFQVWYGMRLGESHARSQRYKDIKPCDLNPAHVVMGSKYPKYMDKLGVSFRLPILDWEDEDVYEYLGDELNPLYKAGFDRVGCFPCLAAGDKYKEKAFSFDEVGKQRRIEILNLSQKIGKNIFTTKGGRLRNPDADPFNNLDTDYNPNNDELAPCFHCNI